MALLVVAGCCFGESIGSLGRNDDVVLSTSGKIGEPGLIVTFIDDDGAENSLDRLEALADVYGFSVCTAIVLSDTLPNALTKYSYADYRRVQAKGWEIASHNYLYTMDYTNGYSSTINDVTNALRVAGEQRLVVKNHVYSHGVSDEAGREVVSQYYRSAIKVGGDLNTPPFLQYNAKRYTIDNIYDPTGTAAGDVAYINNINTNGEPAWIIYMSHLGTTEGQVLDNGGGTSTVERMTAVMDYCSVSNIPVVTIDAALDLLGNKVMEGDYWVDYLDAGHGSGELGIFSNPYFVMGADGSMANSDVRVLVKEPNGVGSNTPITDFGKYSVTYMSYNSADTGSADGALPSSAGLLTTYRTHQADIDLAFQHWENYNNGASWKRTAASSTTWNTWLPMYATLQGSLYTNSVVWSEIAAGATETKTFTIVDRPSTLSTSLDIVIFNSNLGIDSLFTTMAWVNNSTSIKVRVKNNDTSAFTPETVNWLFKIIR
jgi:hypothetical protein